MSGARSRYFVSAEEPLTPRMLDYLRAAAAGMTREETAAHLSVSIESAKQMRKLIIQRLGARNTTHAVAIAYEKGLLP